MPFIFLNAEIFINISSCFMQKYVLHTKHITNYQEIMNIRLVQAYIAKKVAMRHSDFAFARKTMNREEYLNMVLEKKVYRFDPEVLMNAKTSVMRRFNIKEHGMIFIYPTLRQWITDFTGTWEKEDILAFFSEHCGLTIQTLQKATIGGNSLYRDHLIGLIEELEEATGKKLGSDNIDDPLAYLGDDITYDEIAEYFSCSGYSPRIDEKMQADIR